MFYSNGALSGQKIPEECKDIPCRHIVHNEVQLIYKNQKQYILASSYYFLFEIIINTMRKSIYYPYMHLTNV